MGSIERKLSKLTRYLLSSKYIIVYGFIFSLVIAIGTEVYINDKKRTINVTKLEKIAADIERRLEYYLHPLQGTAGVYHVLNQNVLASTYRNYSLSRDMFNNFPGALGFGFIRKVTHPNLNTYMKNMRKERPYFSLRRLEKKLIATPKVIFMS